MSFRAPCSAGGFLYTLLRGRALLTAALMVSVGLSQVALSKAQQISDPGLDDHPAVALTPIVRAPVEVPPSTPPEAATDPSMPIESPGAESVTVLVGSGGIDSGDLALAPDGPDVTFQSLIPRVNGPEYGMNIFVWDAPRTTDRDLSRIADAKFGWQKTLFQWRLIEPRRGVFNWSEADRVVKASAAKGVKVIARVDFQPDWARADGAQNGPPDNYDDFGDFIYALADRYKTGSPYGSVAAIEMWNEPNLWRDWGSQPIGPGSAADYVRLLCTGNQAAKRAAPDTIVISGALTPTGTLNSEAADDVVYTQWMYDAGAKPCFDALGAHGAGYKAPPWIGPAELATNPQWGGDQSFGFRRVEQIRDVMVRNGDAAKQVWLTEFGWSSDPIHPSYAWHRVSEEQKADYVVEAYRWAYLHWQPWIGVMVLWNVSAPDWSESREEYWWSVTNPDGSTRPAYDALVSARAIGYLPDPN